jgi:hypothetical protein
MLLNVDFGEDAEAIIAKHLLSAGNSRFEGRSGQLFVERVRGWSPLR